MIACDNNECQYQWVRKHMPFTHLQTFSLPRILNVDANIFILCQFHISCVNVKAPLPDTWYCEECKAKLGIIETFTPVPLGVPATTGSRKGRKKQ